MSSSNNTNNNTNNSNSKKRVRFGSSTVQSLPEQDSSISVEDLWYRADVLKAAMRDGIIHMLKVYKSKELKKIGQCPVMHPASASDVEEEEEEETDMHTSRGLEAYQPGQLYNRRKARQQFTIFVLSNYEEFLNLFDTPEEVQEELENYSSALSQPGKVEAQRLAHQDALEAQMIYADLPKEFSFISSNSNSNNDSRCALTALVKLNSETDLAPFRQAKAA